MANIGWRENRPRDRDKVHSIGTEWQSMKTSIEAAMEEHFYWDENSGVSAGDPRFSVGTGSARAFYGPRSEVSQAKHGTTMIVSDESRLIGFPDSGGSVLLGGSNVVLAPSTTASTATDFHQAYRNTLNSKRVILSGTKIVAAGVANSVVFDSAFGGIAETAPKVVLITQTTKVGTSSAASYKSTVSGTFINTSGFSLACEYIGPGADPAEAQINYISFGTVPL